MGDGWWERRKPPADRSQVVNHQRRAQEGVNRQRAIQGEGRRVLAGRRSKQRTNIPHQQPDTIHQTHGERAQKVARSKCSRESESKLTNAGGREGPLTLTRNNERKGQRQCRRESADWIGTKSPPLGDRKVDLAWGVGCVPLRTISFRWRWLAE